VPYNEIAEKNEFNLNVPRYIDSSEPEDIHDLDAHLNGGIPTRDIDALQNYWDVFPTLRKALFSDKARKGYANALVEARNVKTTILVHEEYQVFKKKSLKLYTSWRTKHADALNDIKIGDKPKELIFDLSEDLLTRFTKADLLSKYDIYQILMDYWAETMQDDVYMLSQDGWGAGNVVRLLAPVKVKKAGKKDKFEYKEEHDFEFGAAKSKKRYKSDIVPPALVIARYFADKQEALDKLQEALDTATQKLEEYIEENSGEEGLIEEAKNEKGSIAKKGLTDRIKASNDDDEITALKKCLALLDAQSKCKSAVKVAKDTLDKLVFEKIPAISEAELKDLIVNSKWFATIEVQIVEEIERMTQQLANRVKTLEERYSETMPDLSKDVVKYTGLVEGHLKKMGLSW
jgi:type I restriction enzyme M protein